MKNVIYILAVLIILLLGGIIIFSPADNNITRYGSQYTSYNSSGVDLSEANFKGTTSYKSNQANADFSNSSNLVATDNFDGSNINSENIRSNNKNNSFQKIGGNNATSFSSQNSRNTNSSDFSGSNPMLMGIRKSGSTGSGTNSSQSGLLAQESSSLGNSMIRHAIPMDPFSDYNENDLTHPGGNPMGHAIPVGKGIIPLFLFTLAYIVFIIYKKRIKQSPK